MYRATIELFTVALLVASAGSALAEVHYVDLNSTNATPPYTSWATAATNIQDAVDAAVAGDEVVVADGNYGAGGRDGNRVLVRKPLTLRSVNGPQFTSIDGGISVRCLYLTNGAAVSGFSLINGFVNAPPPTGGGGGVFCASPTASVSNCVLHGNRAVYANRTGYIFGTGGGASGGTLYNCTLDYNSAAGSGGGATGCTLNNCILTGNSASTSSSSGGANATGGGATGCTLNNCTLAYNSASTSGYFLNAYGGGAAYSTLNNCILTGNSAVNTIYSPYYPPTGQGYGGAATYCTLNNCIIFSNMVNNCSVCDLDYFCTTSLCWFSNPLLVASGSLRLEPNSPCINAGNNSYATIATDLDGNPRISGGTVDIGAYEFQSPVSRISYAWLQQYGLPISAATDAADPDGDGVDNWHEWLASTDPTNPLSSPAQLTIIPSGPNLILMWPTNAVGFALQCTTNLGPSAVWSTNSPAPLVANGLNTVTNPITAGQQFYRLSQ
jgi:hypothetical protein